MSIIRKTSEKLYKFSTTLVDNRIFDLYIWYQEKRKPIDEQATRTYRTKCTSTFWRKLATTNNKMTPELQRRYRSRSTPKARRQLMQ